MQWTARDIICFYFILLHFAFVFSTRKHRENVFIWCIYLTRLVLVQRPSDTDASIAVCVPQAASAVELRSPHDDEQVLEISLRVWTRRTAGRKQRKEASVVMALVPREQCPRRHLRIPRRAVAPRL